MADVRRIGLDEIARHFETLEDPRSSVNRKHPLVSVVVIAILAVLAGAAGPTAIARWAALKEEFLLQVLDLPDGVPGKDVFRRVLMALRPEAFRACFLSWLGSLRGEATAARRRNRLGTHWASAPSRRGERRPCPGRRGAGQGPG